MDRPDAPLVCGTPSHLLCSRFFLRSFPLSRRAFATTTNPRTKVNWGSDANKKHIRKEHKADMPGRLRKIYEDYKMKSDAASDRGEKAFFL